MDWTGFGKLLRSASTRILWLDYDGTLAPFHEDRMQAQPYPGVREALNRILRAGHTRVAIVTGRTVETVRPLLGFDPAPEIWGIHGWQRLHADGRREDFDPGSVVRAGIQKALAFAQEPWGARFPEQWEAKPISVAFHFRGLPEAEHAEFMRRIEPHWRAIAAEHGLGLHAFDFGMELRVPGRTKGTVVREMLAEAKGAGDKRQGRVAAAFLGDDYTDEDAFREIATRNDPTVLGVLVRPAWRSTAARAWISPPAGLLEFLDRWHEAAPTQ